MNADKVNISDMLVIDRYKEMCSLMRLDMNQVNELLGLVMRNVGNGEGAKYDIKLEQGIHVFTDKYCFEKDDQDNKLIKIRLANFIKFLLLDNVDKESLLSIPADSIIENPILAHNFHACLAKETIDIERHVLAFQFQLNKLIKADKGTENAFKRFCDKKRKVISPKHFRIMLQQLLPKALNDLNVEEIDFSMFRYVDFHGLGEITLDAFQVFCKQDLLKTEALYNHPLSCMTNICQKARSFFVTDCVLTPRKLTLSQFQELVDTGYVRAQGRNKGLWLKRNEVEDFDSLESFFRNRVTDVQWVPRDKVKVWIEKGYFEARKLFNTSGGSVSKRHTLMLQRNIGLDVAVTNLSIQEFGSLPPAFGFKIYNKQQLELSKKRVLWIRKLSHPVTFREDPLAKSKADQNSEALLEVERREVMFEQQLQHIQIHLQKQLKNLFFQAIHEENEDRVVDLEQVLRNQARENQGAITEDRLAEILTEIGLKVPSTESQWNIMRSQIGFVAKDGRILYRVKTLIRFLFLNPRAVFEALREIAELRPKFLEQGMPHLKSHRVSTDEFVSTLQKSLKMSHWDSSSAEVQTLVACFGNKQRTAVDLEMFYSALVVVYQKYCSLQVEVPMNLELELKHVRQYCLDTFRDILKFGEIFHTMNKISRQKFKATLMQLLNVSDTVIETCMANSCLATCSFIGPPEIAAFVEQLENMAGITTAPRILMSPTGSPKRKTNQDGDNTIQDVTGWNVLRKGRLTPLEMETLRKALSVDVQDFVLAQTADRIDESLFLKTLRELGIQVEIYLLEKFLSRARSVTSNGNVLDRLFILRTIWPDGPTSFHAHYKIDAALDKLQSLVRQSFRQGVSLERFWGDIVCSDVEDESELSAQTFSHTMRKLVANPKVSVEDAPILEQRLRERSRIGEGAVFFRVLKHFVRSCELTVEDKFTELEKAEIMKLTEFSPLQIIDHLKRWDMKCRGYLGEEMFSEAIHELIPGLSHHIVTKMIKVYGEKGKLYYSTKDFSSLFGRDASSRGMAQLKDIVQRVRNRIKSNHEIRPYVWNIFRRYDVPLYGVISRSQFREILFDKLCVNHTISESEFRVLCTWFQATVDFEIDYDLFCRCLAPTKDELEEVLARLRDYLSSTFQISGNAWDIRNAFAFHDADDLGFVSREAFVKVCVQIGLFPTVVSRENVQTLVEALDPIGRNQTDYNAFATMLVLSQTSTDEFYYLMQIGRKLHRFVSQHGRDILRVLRQVDEEQFGIVTMDEFLRAMTSVHCPLEESEMFVVMEHLEWNSEEIEYERALQDIAYALGPFGKLSLLERYASPGYEEESQVTSGPHAFRALYDKMRTSRARRAARKKRQKQTIPVKEEEKRNPHKEYKHKGTWICPVCAHDNQRIRFSKLCAMCEEPNPYYKV